MYNSKFRGKGLNEKIITKTAFKAIYRFNNNNHTDDMVVHFLFYTASVASRVFQDLLYVAAILLSLYIVNRRMKMYIKMSWIFFDTECSNRWYSVLFLFRKTGAYVEDTEKNGKNCGSICAASA